MRNDLTDVTLVIDRSGSMLTCREDAEGGVNSFIDEQKKQPGECLFSLVQFDTEYEFVYRGCSIQSVERYTLKPRGCTALLDAVGRAVNETGARLEAMSENERPGLVVFVIVTDGQENSSHEFTKQQVKDMVQLQQDSYKWQFLFLGANQDAFAEAGGIGIRAACSSGYSCVRTDSAISCASSKLSAARDEILTSGGLSSDAFEFSDDERASLQ